MRRPTARPEPPASPEPHRSVGQQQLAAWRRPKAVLGRLERTLVSDLESADLPPCRPRSPTTAGAPRWASKCRRCRPRQRTHPVTRPGRGVYTAAASRSTRSSMASSSPGDGSALARIGPDRRTGQRGTSVLRRAVLGATATAGRFPPGAGGRRCGSGRARPWVDEGGTGCTYEVGGSNAGLAGVVSRARAALLEFSGCA
jgi:hypothetical protein